MTRGEHIDLRYTAFRKGGDPDLLEDRINLSGAVAYWRMKKDAQDSAVEVAKESSFPIQAMILPQGVLDATRGQYDVFLVPSDTAAPGTPLPHGKHTFDTWVELASGRRHAVVTLGELVIRREVTDLTVVIPPPIVGTPAPQTSQERSFQHTWSATGVSDPVAIPGGPGAMFDAGYVVSALISHIPVGGVPRILQADDTGRTVDSFTLRAYDGAGIAAALTIGTIIDIIVRDRA
jgi:hypothetical protein